MENNNNIQRRRIHINLRPSIRIWTLIRGLILLPLTVFILLIIDENPSSNRVSRNVDHESEVRRRLVTSYGQIPMHFEANRGQADEQVQFISRGGGYTLFLTSDEAVLSLRRPETGQEEPESGDRRPETGD